VPFKWDYEGFLRCKYSAYTNKIQSAPEDRKGLKDNQKLFTQ